MNDKKETQIKIFKFTIRLVVSFLIVSFFCLFFGRIYIKTILPLISLQVKFLHPEYNLNCKIDSKGSVREIETDLTIHRRHTDEDGNLGTERDVKFSLYASSLFTHPIIVFSFLLAWSFDSSFKKIKTFLIAIPLMLIVVLIDIPINIINTAEHGIINNSFMGKVREFADHFFLNGGRQFFSLLVVFLSIKISSAKKPKTELVKISRNAPCPCGSGKKFKHCCG